MLAWGFAGRIESLRRSIGTFGETEFGLYLVCASNEMRIRHETGRPRKANQLPEKRRSADRTGSDGLGRAAAHHAERRSEARRSGCAKLCGHPANAGAAHTSGFMSECHRTGEI